MAEYKSAYTGGEIDAGIAKAYTAVQPGELARVATSGNYADLENTPNEVTEETVSDWGFTKNTGTYSKPSGGIPETDLAESVQTSLGKADTALQDIKVNGTSIAVDGVADIEADGVYNPETNKLATSSSINNVMDGLSLSKDYSGFEPKFTIGSESSITYTMDSTFTFRGTTYSFRTLFENPDINLMYNHWQSIESGTIPNAIKPVNANNTPTITSTETYCSANALNITGTVSKQIIVTGPAHRRYFGACKVRVDSYTSGYFGMLGGGGSGASADAESLSSLHGLSETTDGWVTSGGNCVPYGTGKTTYLGSGTSASGTGYLDLGVVLSFANLTIAECNQLLKLYNLYAEIKKNGSVTDTLSILRTLDTTKPVDETSPDCTTKFLSEMNKRATRIGMSNNTIFTSPSGLDSTTNGNRSTAKDMIKLMLEAISCEELMKVWGKPSWTITMYGPHSRTKVLESTVTNPSHGSVSDVTNYYNILGGKTGTITVSGTPYYNYCAVAEKDGKYVVATLFQASSSNGRYGQMKTLLDNAFGKLNDSNYTTTTVGAKCASCELPSAPTSMLQNFTPTILYAENEETQVYIASTTKIMTSLIACEYLHKDELLAYIAADDVGGSGDDMDDGDIATFEDMLMDTMLPSSNGCAHCIARIAGARMLELGYPQ